MWSFVPVDCSHLDFSFLEEVYTSFGIYRREWLSCQLTHVLFQAYLEIINGSNEDTRPAQCWERAPEESWERPNQEWVITADQMQPGATIYR